MLQLLTSWDVIDTPDRDPIVTVPPIAAAPLEVVFAADAVYIVGPSPVRLEQSSHLAALIGNHPKFIIVEADEGITRMTKVSVRHDSRNFQTEMIDG